MRLYFFDSIDKKYAIPFRLFAVNQNLKVARFTSLLTAILGIGFTTFILLFYDISYQKYLWGWSALAVMSVLYHIAITFSGRIQSRERILIKKYLGSTFPVVIIIATMWMSFVSGRSPSDNMTIFMFGLLFVGVSWVFTRNSALAISSFTFFVLIIGLYLFEVPPIDIFKNVLSGGIIIIGFYFISRLIYSFHVNHHIQLKIIEHNNNEINKIAQLKTEMLGIVAHDLRSPVNSITALANLLNDCDVTKDEKSEYCNLVIEACNESHSIINDLILVVKGDSMQGLKLQQTNLNLFLAEVQQHWTHKLPNQKELLLKLPDKVLEIPIDKDKMLRVLDNLISNAIKFTDADGVIQIQLDKDKNDAIRISIKDNGIGIPDDIKPYLFDRFSKAGRLGLQGEKSHGLGLNICKQIVEQHGGNITVESIAGEGSAFYLSFSTVADYSDDKTIKDPFSTVTYSEL